jgi:hypothetical protein
VAAILALKKSDVYGSLEIRSIDEASSLNVKSLKCLQITQPTFNISICRVASMQDGADQNKNPKVMHEKIRNLRRSPETGSLWLFDNESGLFDGYELMYPHKPRYWSTKFIDFHKTMLQSICIFRKSTVDNIRRLTASNSPQETLISFAAQHEPLLHKLRNMHYHRQFMTYFHERLYDVSDWIDSCKKR